MSSCWMVSFSFQHFPHRSLLISSFLPPAHTHTLVSSQLNLSFLWCYLKFFIFACPFLSLSVSHFICMSLPPRLVLFFYPYSYFPLSLHLVIALSNPLNRCLDPSLSNIHLSFFLFLSFHLSPLLVSVVFQLVFFPFQSVSSSLNHLSSSRAGLSSLFHSLSLVLSLTFRVFISWHQNFMTVDDRYQISNCNLIHLYRCIH